MSGSGGGRAGAAEVQRAVLMADIVSSTELYERLGDQRARELVATGLAEMDTTISAHGGRLIKSMGDGVLACFEGPGAAPAALEICDRVASLMLQVRVGAHFGSVIDDGGDIFGDTVNTTARLASVARPSEILISKHLWVKLPDELRQRGRSIPPVMVKGKQTPLELFSILTECSGIAETFLEVPTPEQAPAPSTVQLRSGEATIDVALGSTVLVGRGQECDLQIDHEKASRRHARIFCRPPDVLLEDTSTNGTTIVQPGGARVLVRRREVVLFGSGEIFPGSTPGEEGAQPIAFEVRRS